MVRKGISAPIAEIIIVAVTVAIAFAAISWLTDIWGFWSSDKYENMLIYSDSYFNNADNSVYLHIKINMKPQAVINKIDVVNANVTDISIYQVIKGRAYMQDDSVVIDVGSEVILKITVDKSFPPGTEVHGKLYTENGFVYPWSVRST